MNTKLKLFQARLLYGVALGLGTSFGLNATAGDSAKTAPAKTSQAIPWSQIGSKAGADYEGDGLAVSRTSDGARLRCVFQRLEGEATREGLWLISTVTNGVCDRFRLVAAEVGTRSTASPNSLENGTRWNASLPQTGTVAIAGQTVRFTRPGLVEEYSVSMDGLRQDFIIDHPPLNPPASTLNQRPGELAVQLAVSGARVEPVAGGARLVLEHSGRKIAYSRLRVTDATGKELTARIEVIGHGESQRDSVTQPRVASPRATLGNSEKNPHNPETVAFNAHPCRDQPRDVTPLGLEINSRNPPRVARLTRNPGLMDAIPSGLSANTTERQTKTQPDDRAPMLVVLVNDADAVYPVRIDPTFSDANWVSMNPSIPGADGQVFAAVVDGSGNLYIGGYFTVVGDVIANNIAKWDGSRWAALGSGPNSGVYALAMSGSDLYAGGNFTTAGGTAANYMAKWNGSSWSALGSGMNDTVFALAVSGSDLYAGGRFTTANESAANSIAKWDGSNWSALGSGMGGPVLALAVSGSDLFAGGEFRLAGGSVVNGIAKWDGSSWSGLNLGMGAGGVFTPSVIALAVSGSNVYAGGEFTTANESAANNIAKWDGSSWTALGSGMNGRVSALAVSGSNLYAGGTFTTAGGAAANYIAKWNGSSWSALGSELNGYGGVLALVVSDSDLFAGGDFTTAGGSGVENIAKWNGGSWSALAFGSGMNRYVSALAVSGSNLYAGGVFTFAGGSTVNYIAKWDGSSWTALGSGMDSFVNSLAVSGSSVNAGGQFTTAGGNAANFIAKWDGSSWTPLGAGMNGYVSALAVSGSDLYAGGYFTTAGGGAASCIAKWNGSSWSALGSGMNDTVFALAVSGTNLYAGGGFTNAGGIAASHIAKWNGSSWSKLGSGMNGYDVSALAVSGSDLYAGGYFTTAGGGAANSIAKWDGSGWSALGWGVSYGYGSPGGVSALAVSGSDVYAGGGFTTAGGSAATNIAKWNGSTWSALGSGVNNNQVNALAVSGSDLYAGGFFTTAGGKVSAYVARAIVNPPVLAIEGDGDGGYFIRFSGVPGSAYRLERAPGLSGPWATSSAQTAPASGLLEFWDLFPPTGQGFYRSVGP